MRQARDKRSSDPRWILFAEAVALLSKFYLVPKRAVQRLLEGLSSGDVEWRCRELKGWQPPHPGQGDSLFWRGGRGWQVRLGRETSSAQRMRLTRLPNGRTGYAGYGAYGVEVPRAAVLALLPERASAAAPTRRRKPTSAAELKAAIKEFERARSPDAAQPTEQGLWDFLEDHLGHDVTREEVRYARQEMSPQLRRPPGRPRKSSPR